MNFHPRSNEQFYVIEIGKPHDGLFRVYVGPITFEKDKISRAIPCRLKEEFIHYVPTLKLSPKKNIIDAKYNAWVDKLIDAYIKKYKLKKLRIYTERCSTLLTKEDKATLEEITRTGIMESTLVRQIIVEHLQRYRKTKAANV